MKLFITGANGQLGRELLALLKNQKSDLGVIPSIFHNAEVTALDLPALDIAHKQMLDRLKDKSFDLIINCAAYTNVDACEENEDLAYQVNALGAKNLAVFAQETGAKLIHVSTDYVFNGQGKSPYREMDPCAPQSAYGRTKLQGELLVKENCKKHFIVRTAWLYGLDGNNFVKTIRRLAQNNATVNVVNDQVGNPTYAHDLAHHLLKLAATDQYGTYHCTGKGICSWYEFACEIVHCSHLKCAVKPCTTAEFPRPAKRPAYSALSHENLEKAVGDEMRDWKTALHAYIERLEKE